MPSSHLKRLPDTHLAGATVFGPTSISPSALYADLSTSAGLNATIDLIFTLTDSGGSTIAQAEQIFVQVHLATGTISTSLAATTGAAGVGSFLFGQGSRSGSFAITTAATGIASISVYGAPSGATSAAGVRWYSARVVSADGVGGATSLASVSI